MSARLCSVLKVCLVLTLARLPEGLEDVSRYPHLFAELMSDPSWTVEDLKKLAGHNLLRVMRDAERVRGVKDKSEAKT